MASSSVVDEPAFPPSGGLELKAFGLEACQGLQPRFAAAHTVCGHTRVQPARSV